MLASAGSPAVRVWDALTGQEAGQLKGHGGNVSYFRVAAGGQTLVTGSVDTTALTWDLTRLARRNDGRFPSDAVYAAIDGREKVRGHGPGSMPVWGLSLQTSGLAADQEQEVREKLLDLVAYLESIQEK